MSYNEANIELFDRYLSGKMSSEEHSAFEEKLASNKEFAEAFRLHKLLAEGIREHARTELKSYIKVKGEIQYWGGNIWPKSMTYAAAAVFVLFTGLYLVLRNYTKPVLEKEIAVQTDVVKPESGNADTVIMPPAAEIQEFEAPVAVVPGENDMPAAETLDDKSVVAEDKDMTNEWTEDIAVSGEDVAEKYKVLSEKLLSDTVISAPVLLAISMEVPASADYEYSRNQMSGTSVLSKSPAAAGNKAQTDAIKKQKTILQDTAVSKTETEAKSIKKLDEAKTLILEYWYSPVNFKGYRYSNNTIRVYGIDKNSCRLFIYNNEVYLRLDGKVYLLSVCPVACVFNLEKNTEITNLILRQN